MKLDPICKSWYLYNDHLHQGEIDLAFLKKDAQSAVSTLATGWLPISIWSVQNSLLILLLENSEEKKQALWYFDSNGKFLGNSAKSIWGLGAWIGDDFRRLFKRFLLEVFEQKNYKAILVSGAIPPLLVEFEVLAHDLYKTAINIHSVSGSEDAQMLIATSATVQDEVLKQSQGVMSLIWRGRKLSGNHGVVLNDFVFVYPLYHGESLSALLFVGSHEGVRIGCLDLFEMDLSYRIIPGCFELAVFISALVIHIKDNLTLLMQYFKKSPLDNIVGVTRSDHMGHYLWNELSGLYRVEQTGGAKYLSSLIHLDKANVGELWIDSRKVLSQADIDVSLSRDVKEIAKRVYESGAFPLRIGDSYIPKGLTDLIVADCLACSKAIIPSKLPGELRVVFGLRFENRTWVNQAEGLSELACYLASLAPKVTIIVDGHDRVDGRKSVSHLEHLASSDIVLLEKGVIQTIRDALTSQSLIDRVSVVDAVDTELRDTIAWVISADFFVAPWGAGLAKYKWVANLDGVIFSSRQVLESKPDLRIYENPKIREGAKECIYLPVEYISDQTDASTIINIPGPAEMRNNFIVDIAGLKLAVDKLLERVLWDVK